MIIEVAYHGTASARPFMNAVTNVSFTVVWAVWCIVVIVIALVANNLNIPNSFIALLAI